MDKRNKSENLVGQTFTTKYGETFKVISVRNSCDITVEYIDGALAKTQAYNIRKGNIANPNRITTCGVGFTGVGTFPLSVDGVKTDAYVKWQSMLNRVYGIKRKSTLCYKNVEVNPVWFNFQVFAEWFKSKYDKIKDYKGEVCLDKDCLVIGNTIYGPDTCCLIPYEINIAMQLVDDFYFCKERELFVVNMTKANSDIASSSKFIGRYKTKEECLYNYGKAKDTYISYLFEKYATFIPENVGDALRDFKAQQRFLTMKDNKQ